MEKKNKESDKFKKMIEKKNKLKEEIKAKQEELEKLDIKFNTDLGKEINQICQDMNLGTDEVLYLIKSQILENKKITNVEENKNENEQVI